MHDRSPQCEALRHKAEDASQAAKEKEEDLALSLAETLLSNSKALAQLDPWGIPQAALNARKNELAAQRYVKAEEKNLKAQQKLRACEEQATLESAEPESP